MTRGLSRRTVTAIAAAAGVRSLLAQTGIDPGAVHEDATDSSEVRLPSGKRQRDEILRSEYRQNLKDARELTDLTKSFELDLEKSDRFVLSVGLLKKLDDIERLTRRIRGRMRH